MKRDTEAMRMALAGYLPDRGAIDRVTQIAAGFSNETYLIEGWNQILRLPPAGERLLPNSHTVIEQAGVYAALSVANSGPSTPMVMHVCEDPAILGDPFFIMQRMEGEAVEENAPQPWFADGTASLRAGICDQWAAAVAGLAHTRPIEVLGPWRSPEEEARRWRAMAVDSECQELVDAFDQLLATPAPRSGPPSIVHGDTKLANLLWKDGRLTALLDWEMAHNGDPLTDLGYLLYFFDSEHHAGSSVFQLSGMYPRDRMIETWSARAGRSAEGVAWYEVAAIGKLAAIMAFGYHLSQAGKSDDIRFRYFKMRADYDLTAMQAKLDTDNFFSNSRGASQAS